jgi:hypothetical protein
LAATCAVAAATHAAGPAPHGLVAEDSYAFGSVRQGDQVSHTFRIRNTGAAPLKITGAALSIPEMNLRVPAPQIPPQGEGSVTVELTTAHKAGAISAQAQIQWNDPAQEGPTLRLEGYIAAPLVIEPLPAIFLSDFAGRPTEHTLTIRNNDSGPLVIRDVRHSPHLDVTIRNVEPGRVLAVAARAAPTAPVGHYEETLILLTDGAGSAAIKIPVHLWIRPDLYANPDRVELGDVRIADAAAAEGGSAVAQTFFLRHRGPFRITALRCDSPMVEVTRSPAGVSATFEIEVRLRPPALRPGILDARIQVTTNDPRFPELTIPVSGRLL